MNLTLLIRVVCTLLLGLLLSACGPQAAPPSQPAAEDAPTAQVPVEEESAQEDETPAEDNEPAGEREEPDLSSLPIGDGNLSTSARAGYLWSCMTNFNENAGGAEGTGDWYQAETGVWNFYLKPVVDGEVDWDSAISISVQGDLRVFDANGLPAHPTGNYPISQSDDAYQFDSNPNSISVQSFHLELPANPIVNAQPECVRGEVGISIDGVVINNAVDALGRDAVASEIQDLCAGHPHGGGVYHYHGYSTCLEDQDAEGHSALVGYALDGFGIFGPYDTDGSVLASEDLDECHGHTHEIDWDGNSVDMFHYHTTFDYPYTVGCYRGTPVVFTDALSGEGGPQGP